MAIKFDTYDRPDWSETDLLQNEFFYSNPTHTFTALEELQTFNIPGVTWISFYAIGNNTAPLRFQFAWKDFPIGGNIIDTDEIVIPQAQAMFGLFATRGPVVTISVDDATPAVANTVQFFMSFNRVSGQPRGYNFDRVPIATGVANIAAGGNQIFTPNPCFFGDGDLTIDSAAASWNYTLTCFDINGVGQTFHQCIVTPADAVRIRLAFPTRRWTLQLNNTSAGAANFRASVIPAWR